MKIKTNRLLTFALALVAVSCITMLQAQEPDLDGPPPPPFGAEKIGPPSPGSDVRGLHGDRDDRRKHRRKMASQLSDAEHEQFRNAMKKAKDDPAVIKAREAARAQHAEMRKVMREALLRADPAIEPVLNKMRDELIPTREFGKRHDGTGRGGHPNLPDDVRKRLDEAREKAKTYPAVTNAKAKLKVANTREERWAAARELRDALRQVILNIDPTLEPYLKEKSKGRKQGPTETPTPSTPGSM